MENLYTYKDLIESYKYYVEHKGKGAFFKYYKQRYKALSKSFGIDFDVVIMEHPHKEDMRWWFLKSVKATTERINPFAGLMEAPEYLIELYHKHGDDFIKAESLLNKAHFKFQCHLFELIYGPIKTKISSKQLKKNGFDDSQKEPDIADFW